jgi:hypothetical protein
MGLSFAQAMGRRCRSSIASGRRLSLYSWDIDYRYLTSSGLRWNYSQFEKWAGTINGISKQDGAGRRDLCSNTHKV